MWVQPRAIICLFLKILFYSDRLHDFYVTIPGCYKDVYVNSFFPRTARLWNSLPIECFPLTYDICGFKSRISRYLLTVCFNLFVLLFLVSLCLVVAVQPCMQWIPNKKKFFLEWTTHLKYWFEEPELLLIQIHMNAKMPWIVYDRVLWEQSYYTIWILLLLLIIVR